MIKYLNGPTTQRLHHRAFNVDDAEAAYTLNSDPEVLRYTGDKAFTSVEHARQLISEYPDFDKVGYGRWACVLNQTDEVIGFSGLKYLADLDVVDIGFRFMPRYWGLGLGTETCRACLEFGFATIGLKRIVAFVLPDNKASIRVLEKSGMTFDGDFDYDGLATLRFAMANPQSLTTQNSTDAN